MAQATQETMTPKIEIVDQPDEEEATGKSAFRFILPIILTLSVLGVFFLFKRKSRSEE
ncbi:hypothetical protein [Dictyobacter formicarum]|uniref:Gram-positive cocci surface proteins LPxTG domain-containing protein n=1 Tax=Dictyobacter formicarum TaxID=2778368 RepID=A0ABQ3VJ99_9CHLR|nr:hypothetical protein [Dictyobacter formicarum]GHO86237.1 hypothetical protein KSZ_42430 [Dictyobacter formicarum]